MSKEDAARIAELEKGLADALGLAKAGEASKAEAIAAKAELVKQAEQLKALTDEIAKLKGTDNAVDKAAMTPDVRKRFEDMEAVNKANAETIEKMRAETEKRDTEIAIGKAYPKIPQASEVLTPVMLCLAKNDPKAKEALEKVLKGANAAYENVTKEIGTDLGNQDGTESAIGKVEAKAAELRKQDSKLTEHQARAKVFQNDPKLQNEYNLAMRTKQGIRSVSAQG